MSQLTEIKFITSNENKFLEVKNLLETNFDNYRIVHSQVPLTEIQSSSLEEVAIFKIQSVGNNLHPPYFIEDSGFFVDDICNGFPGVYSSYVMKTIGYNGILKIMDNEKTHRKAHFKTVIAYLDENNKIHQFIGIVKGKISEKARGTSGFGFDPIFIPDDRNDEHTFAEISTEEKNKISHRSRAFHKLIAYLENNE